MMIDIIVGARPNFIKVASLIKYFDQYKKFKYRLIHTGQHYDYLMSKIFFEDLDIPKPHINLNVKGKTRITRISKIMIQYEKILQLKKPKLCIVVGDVDSTLACSITAISYKLNIAHIESGLRSGDLGMPEEVNRIITDTISKFHFVTTNQAKKTLVNLGIKKDNIFFVGNTMIDALRNNLHKLKKPKFLENKRTKYYVLTIHRREILNDRVKLNNIINLITDKLSDNNIFFPVHPNTLKFLDKSILKTKNLYRVKPLSYLEFIYLIKNSQGIITDSGGVSEEATVLNVPCITLRKNTERPETVKLGTNEVMGDSLNDLLKLLNKLKIKRWKKGKIPKYWDGKSSKRIFEILKHKLV